MRAFGEVLVENRKKKFLIVVLKIHEGKTAYVFNEVK